LAIVEGDKLRCPTSGIQPQSSEGFCSASPIGYEGRQLDMLPLIIMISFEKRVISFWRSINCSFVVVYYLIMMIHYLKTARSGNTI